MRTTARTINNYCGAFFLALFCLFATLVAIAVDLGPDDPHFPILLNAMRVNIYAWVGVTLVGIATSRA